MKKLINRLLIVVLVVFFISCNKEHNTFISLKFFDAFTLEECHDVNINIYEMDDLAHLNTGSKKLIYSFNTNNTNTLEVILEGLNNNKKYWAEFESPISCFKMEGIEIMPNEKNTYHRNLAGRLNLKLHVKNLTPFNHEDYLRIVVTNDENPNAISWPKAISFGEFGMSVDKNHVNFFEGVRFKELYIKASVTKNDITTLHFDTIVLSSCDTLRYEFLY